MSHDTTRRQLDSYADSLESMHIKLSLINAHHVRTAIRESEVAISELNTCFFALASQIYSLIAEMKEVDTARGDSGSNKRHSKLMGSADEIVDNINAAIVSLQFQDRISQILTHVIDNSDSIAGKVDECRGLRMSGSVVQKIEVDDLLEMMKERYSTPEEYMNHEHVMTAHFVACNSETDV